MKDWFNSKDFNVGDVVAKNHGSFKHSLPYLITNIENGIYTCRLIKNEKSEKLLKMNKNYANKEIVFDSNNFSSFPTMIKINYTKEKNVF